MEYTYDEIDTIPTYWNIGQSEESKFGHLKIFSNPESVKVAMEFDIIKPITLAEASNKPRWGSGNYRYNPNASLITVLRTNYDTSG
jgi:hypothetical protein